MIDIGGAIERTQRAGRFIGPAAIFEVLMTLGAVGATCALAGTAFVDVVSDGTMDNPDLIESQLWISGGFLVAAIVGRILTGLAQRHLNRVTNEEQQKVRAQVK